MTSLATLPTRKADQTEQIPLRLHHNAYVVRDQAVTNTFYAEVLGFPLTQFWIEDTSFEGQPIVLSHAFYGLKDGSALCFFCMATPELYEKFKSPETQVFNHVALLVEQSTQDAMLERLVAADYKNFTIEHGYCKSLYVVDPDGLRLEFTADDPRIEQIKDVQARTAQDTLQRWLSGDRRSNNDWRH